MLQTISRQRVIELIEELPNESLPEVAKFIEYLRFKAGETQERAISLDERTLLERIHRRLPLGDQQRLSALREKGEMGQLTEVEHQELLAYVERVEREDAERAEALVELAHLRRVPLADVMREFAPEPAANAN